MTTQPEPENHIYYPALDGLRAFAVVIVFLGHYFHIPYGYTGVSLFFVLSGFLITGILYDTRDQPNRFRTFYIRRTLRIFPLYLGVFFVILLLAPIIRPEWNALWWAWPAYLGNLLRLVPITPVVLDAANGWLTVGRHSKTLLYFGHFWSLCLEEQFYLFWPWVVFRAYTWRRIAWICLGAMVVCPVLRVLYAAGHPQPAADLVLYAVTPFRLDSLLLGGLLALALRSAYRNQVLTVARRSFAVAALALIPVLIPMIHASWNYYPYARARLTWGESFLDLFFAAMLATALQPKTLLYRLLNLRSLRALGRISYGIYVFHDIPHPLYRAFALWLGRYSRFAASHIGISTAVPGAIGTLILSWLSFRYFETPFLRLKDRWAPSRPARS